MNPDTLSPDPAKPTEVDARGLRCPLPVIRLAQAARDAPAGTRIVLLASDPAARHDVPAWCRMRDHDLLEMTEVREVPEVSTGSEVTAGAELTDGAEVTADAEVVTADAEVAESSGGDGRPAEGGHPAYLRFLVLVRSQWSKAAGAGSGSERPSRTM